VASIQAKGVVELCQSFLPVLVSAVDDPSVCLQQRGRSQVLVAVPPIRRTRRGAASTENALIQPVEFGALFLRLQSLLAVGGEGRLCLQPGLLGLMLMEKLRQIGNQIFKDMHVRERVDDAAVVVVVDLGKTGGRSVSGPSRS